jgi:hypothetical protein
VELNIEPREHQKLQIMKSEIINRSAKVLLSDEEEKVEENCFYFNSNESVYQPHKESSDIEECFIKVKERKKRTDVSFSMKRIDKNKLCEINK